MLLQLKGCFPAENAINAVCSDVIKQKIILTERMLEKFPFSWKTEAQKVVNKPERKHFHPTMYSFIWISLEVFAQTSHRQQQLNLYSRKHSLIIMQITF